MRFSAFFVKICSAIIFRVESYGRELMWLFLIATLGVTNSEKIIEFGSKYKVKKYKGGLSTERGERRDEISGKKIERDKRELNL